MDYYKRDFHLLEYDKNIKAYRFEFVAQGQEGIYIYHFKDKKLAKFELINESKNYHLILEFYDYGSTVIPIQITE